MRTKGIKRYVMSWSQAHAMWVVVYAHDLDEAEARFENGEFVYEENE